MREEGAATSSPKPAPFLTDEQRAALDQALRDKAQGMQGGEIAVAGGAYPGPLGAFAMTPMP